MLFRRKKMLKRIQIICLHSLLLITVVSLILPNPTRSHPDDVLGQENMNVFSPQSHNTHDINWTEAATIIASDGEANDWFGISVAIDGNFSVVGARDDDGERGSAYLFQYFGNQWMYFQKIVATDGIAGDWFGISVAIQGEYIFVGADADDNENGLNAGSVYVFKYNGSLWFQQEKLIASDGTANDYFGRYISVDTDSAVIGAYYDNDTGSAYAFTRLGDNWVEEDKLIASDGAPADYFGVSTAVHGNYALIGAYRDDNGNGIDAGAVYLFHRTRSGWVEEDKFLASDGASSDRFGISTALDSEHLIIGAYYDNAYTGSCYIFTHATEGWVEETKLAASDGEINDFFGRSVSIDDAYVLVGAWGESDSSGSVYGYQHTDTIWFEESKIVASDGMDGDRFGYQVSLDGTNAIIGAYLDDNSNGIDAGSAYIFTRQHENHPPSDLTIEGPTQGTIKVAIEYQFTTTDPDNDEVYYIIDWGDETNSSWIGPYSSSEIITKSHTWLTKGTYMIKAKAKDIYGKESGWETFSVIMPYSDNQSFHLFLGKLFERFPNALPILRHLLVLR
jgi:hypothetical protein